MIETVYQLTLTDDKIIQKIIMDEYINYMHVVLPKGEHIQEHVTNANLYITFLRGKALVFLEDQEPNLYEKNTILNIPFHTRMSIENKSETVLELLLVKAPIPGDMYPKI